MNPFDDHPPASSSTTIGVNIVPPPPTMKNIVRTNPFDTMSDEDDDGFASNSGATAPVPFRHPNDTQMMINHPDDDDDGLFPSSSLSAEATWQYLGDLPYRRVPIYSNVHWGEARDFFHQGLSSYPPSAVQHHPKIVDSREVGALLKKTTFTKCAACPHGGPIAVMTLPLTTTSSAASTSTTTKSTAVFASTELRIMTVAGKTLARIDFPPMDLVNHKAVMDRYPHRRSYTPYDVLEMGFTSSWILIIVLRDSLCLCYNVQGQRVMDPFYILTTVSPIELQLARVYEGGVAVLASNHDAALMEYIEERPHASTTPLENELSSSSTTIPSTSLSEMGRRSSHQTVRQIPSLTHPQSWAGKITHLPAAAEYAAARKCQFGAVAVLAKQFTNSKHPEVFLATSDRSVIIIDASRPFSYTDMDCRTRIAAPIVDMCFAPNGRFLACFTESFILTVISTSFETKVLDFDTSEGSKSSPLAMKWCGEDSVVLHWKTLGVLMVGPYGDWLRFPYENTENVFLLPEIDCCRVITDSVVEILQRVPPATASLLRIGSIDHAAVLLDASDAYHHHQQHNSYLAAAHENPFVSGPEPTVENAITRGDTIMKSPEILEEAVSTLIDAAMKEFDMETQKRLLRAASYGMHFAYKNPSFSQRQLVGGPLSGSDPDTGLLPSRITVQFVDAARKLRIMNTLRNPQVGLLLTSAQFDSVTAAGVIARLIAIKRTALATEISKYLNLPNSVQLFARASRASAFVETASLLTDTETAAKAIAIINGESTNKELEDASSFLSGATSNTNMNRGGYAMVAMAANKVGRPEVAKLILRNETSVADKVPALIASGNFADAIAVATTERYVKEISIASRIYSQHLFSHIINLICLHHRDADFIFSTLMEFEKHCMSSTGSGDPAKAQATFLTAVVTKFTAEAFHMLRRYRETTADTKNVLNLLQRAQRFTDAGIILASRSLMEEDHREKLGMLLVSHCCNCFLGSCNKNRAFLSILSFFSHVYCCRRHREFLDTAKTLPFTSHVRMIIWNW
jgi:hypothetical protein